MSTGSVARSIEQIRAALAARPEVREAYLFGSTARGEAGPLSDLDVAVYLDPDRVERPYALHAASLVAELMTAAGDSRIDLVVLNEAPPLLYHRVLSGGIRLLSRDLARTTTREGTALSRYCDFLPHLAIVDAAQVDRFRAGAFGR